MTEHIKNIPANNNSFNNGLEDPEPEKGPDGAPRRAWWSWVKGLFTKTSK